MNNLLVLNAVFVPAGIFAGEGQEKVVPANERPAILLIKRKIYS